MRSLVCAAALLATGFANQASAASQYADDLAAIYGDLQQVRAWREVCSAEFPATAEANKRAVASWRQQHSAFIREIDQRWAQWISDESKGDPKRKDAMVARFQKVYDETKKDFRQKLLADGRDLFRQRCESYPRYLNSPSMDIETIHAGTLKRLRQAAKL